MTDEVGDQGAGPNPDVRAVAAILQSARRSPRESRSFWDWYINALAVALVTAALISFAIFRTTAPGCLTALCSAGMEASSLTGLLAFTALVHLIGSLTGPVSISAAEAFWVFSSPLERRRLLRRPKVRLVAFALLGGAVASLAHFAFWNGNPWWLATFPMWALLALSVAMGQQNSDSGGKGTTISLLATGMLTAAAVAASPAATATVDAVAVPGIAFVFGALVALFAARRAWNQSDSLPLVDLRRIRGTRDAMAGAISSADSGLLLDTLWARLLTHRTFVSGFRLRTTTWRAVLESETRRCKRSPQLVARMLLLGGIVALGHLAGSVEGLIAISLGVMVFTSLGTSSLRMYVTSPGLSRSFPHSKIVMRLLLALPTSALAGAILLSFSLFTLVLPGWVMLDGLSVGAASIAGLAGGIRWATAPPTQFSAGIVMTEMGPVNASALFNAIRGIDVALLLVVPVLLGLHPLLSLLIAVLVWLWTLLRD